MRNLRNIRYSTWRSSAEHKERQITAAAWDTGNYSVICAYGPSESNPLIELVRVDFHKGSNSG
jgi:elongator complex protein 1